LREFERTCEGPSYNTLDQLTQVRVGGTVSEILEYGPTGEPVFGKLGTTRPRLLFREF
jgi:hypothetical protein